MIHLYINTEPRLDLLMAKTFKLLNKKTEPAFILMSPDGYELMRISQGKFYAIGKEIKDTKQVYERMNMFLDLAGYKFIK